MLSDKVKEELKKKNGEFVKILNYTPSQVAIGTDKGCKERVTLFKGKFTYDGDFIFLEETKKESVTMFGCSTLGAVFIAGDYIILEHI